MGGLVVAEGVPGIDFHQVVDEDHFHHPEKIQSLFPGILGEQQGHQGQVPGMLGTVFVPGSADDYILPQNILQFIGLHNESQLFFQAFLFQTGSLLFWQVLQGGCGGCLIWFTPV